MGEGWSGRLVRKRKLLYIDWINNKALLYIAQGTIFNIL